MNLDWRYERKFAVEQMSLNEAESILFCNNMFFSELYYKRQVNNIYLDSIYMDAYYTNVEGLGNRKKYRVRLEFKHALTLSCIGFSKRRANKSEKFDEKEIYSYITEGIGEDILPENVNFELSSVDPVLINTGWTEQY